MALKLTKRQALIAAGYVVFLLLFFFIGIPKAPLKTYALGFLVVSAFYAVVVWFLLRFIARKA